MGRDRNKSKGKRRRHRKPPTGLPAISQLSSDSSVTSSESAITSTVTDLDTKVTTYGARISSYGTMPPPSRPQSVSLYQPTAREKLYLGRRKQIPKADVRETANKEATTGATDPNTNPTSPWFTGSQVERAGPVSSGVIRRKLSKSRKKHKRRHKRRRRSPRRSSRRRRRRGPPRRSRSPRRRNPSRRSSRSTRHRRHK